MEDQLYGTTFLYVTAGASARRYDGKQPHYAADESLCILYKSPVRTRKMKLLPFRIAKNPILVYNKA